MNPGLGSKARASDSLIPALGDYNWRVVYGTLGGI